MPYHRASSVTNSSDICNRVDVPNKLNAKYYIANFYKYIPLNVLPRVYQILSLYLKMSNILVPFQLMEFLPL